MMSILIFCVILYCGIWCSPNLNVNLIYCARCVSEVKVIRYPHSRKKCKKSLGASKPTGLTRISKNWIRYLYPRDIDMLTYTRGILNSVRVVLWDLVMFDGLTCVLHVCCLSIWIVLFDYTNCVFVLFCWIGI